MQHKRITSVPHRDRTKKNDAKQPQKPQKPVFGKKPTFNPESEKGRKK